MSDTRISTADLLRLAAIATLFSFTSAAVAQISPLPLPEIASDRGVRLGGAPKLGTRVGGLNASTPDRLQFLRTGSTGNISDTSPARIGGGAMQSMNDFQSNEVDAADYGVVPDDGLDDGPAMRQAISVAQAQKASLRTPGGVIDICTDPADTEALLRITSVMEFAGASRGTTILPCATAGDRAVILIKPPASAGGIRGAVLRDFTIGVLGQTRNGGDGIKIDTTNKFGFVAKLLVENVGVANAGAGKYAVHHINVSTVDDSTDPPTQLTGNVTGGLFGSTFRDSDFAGGMKFEQTGDSNNIERNIIFGPNVGIDYNAIGGAATHRIVGNNITSTGGAVVIDGGSQVKVLENQMEQTVAYTGTQTNAAIVTVKGTIDWVIRDNNMNGYTFADAVVAMSGPNGTGATGGTLGPNSVAYAANRYLYRATNSPHNTVERQRREVIGDQAFTGTSRILLDAASITLGVFQPLTLQNSWAETTNVNYRQGLFWMPLPDGTIRLGGRLPGAQRLRERRSPPYRHPTAPLVRSAFQFQ